MQLEAAFVGNHTINNGITKNIKAAQIPGAGSVGQPLNRLFGRLAEIDESIATHAMRTANMRLVF